ncbi:MAG: response regulator transcription factor [Prosthecobacter sp.]|nr:response regulator transcription factor [Prosthecobacter sp.]
MPPRTAIRIMLVDDHSIVRMGLVTLLSSEQDLLVVAEADDGMQAVKLHAEARPDVTLLDLRMPGGIDGIETLKRVREQSPEAKVIVLTTSEFDEDVLRSVEGGAAGYLSKNVSRADLAAAIRQVHGGGSCLPARLAQRMDEWAQRRQLTGRELEVLEFMRRGLSNRDIGRALEISEHTAKAHVCAILGKLGAADRAEAVNIAFERGLVRA